MTLRLSAKLLLICFAVVTLGLSACVVPEELGEATTLTPAPPTEGESSPLAPSPLDDALSSPLELPPQLTPPPTLVATAVAPVVEEPRGPEMDPGSTEMTEGGEEAVTAAVEALADEMKVTADQIEVVSVESVQFRDSSLGCPQKGMMYLQVITPGYQVVLRLEGQTYDYRVAGQQVILCRSGR
jgi:hypothetical protein